MDKFIEHALDRLISQMPKNITLGEFMEQVREVEAEKYVLQRPVAALMVGVGTQVGAPKKGKSLLAAARGRRSDMNLRVVNRKRDILAMCQDKSVSPIDVTNALGIPHYITRDTMRCMQRDKLLESTVRGQYKALVKPDQVRIRETLRDRMVEALKTKGRLRAVDLCQIVGSKSPQPLNVLVRRGVVVSERVPGSQAFYYSLSKADKTVVPFKKKPFKKKPSKKKVTVKPDVLKRVKNMGKAANG